MAAEVLVVSRWLGKASEPWLYRQITGLTRYHTIVAVEAHLNKRWYPFDSVTELMPADAWRRRWMRLTHSLRKGRWQSREQLKLMGIERLLRDHRTTLVHVHFLWNSYVLDVASKLSIPVIFTAHGSDVMRAFVDRDYRATLHAVFAGATRIIAISSFITQRLVALGCPEDKITLLPLGVPLPDQMVPKPRDTATVELLSIGSLVPIKGHRGLLRAFARALRLRPDMHLSIIGEGELREELEREIEQADLQDKVRLLGALPEQEVATALSNSDIYVQMGARLTVAGAICPMEEGLGISYVEAAAHGLPIIGTNAGGVPEICRPNLNGLLVEPDDVAGMADSILRLAGDEQLRARLGEGGRRLVAQAFDQATQISLLEKLYDKVSAKAGEAA